MKIIYKVLVFFTFLTTPLSLTYAYSDATAGILEDSESGYAQSELPLSVKVTI